MNFALGLERHGERTALIDSEDRGWSYRELARGADALYAPGGALAGCSLVAIACANSLHNARAYLGALRAGVPAVLLDGALPAAQRDALLECYDIRCWCGPDGQVERTPGAQARPHAQLALLLSTSGSMGSPKLVRLSLDNLTANAHAIASYLRIGGGERALTVLPIHYSFGLSVLNSHLQAGACVILNDQPVTARAFWDRFTRHQASSLSGVPSTWQLLRQLRMERMALPTLRQVTQAGGRLAPTEREWLAGLAQARGWECFVMYGQTEATARMAYLDPAALAAKPGSIGKAIPGGMLEVVDGEGQAVLQPGVVGQLRYRGPNVMLGYARTAHDLELGDVQAGILDTGDLGYQDAEGYFYVTGRLSRFIKVFGNRIALDELEVQLRAEGRDVAVTGEDDRLVIAARGSCDPATLRADVAARLRVHVSAVHVLAVDDFPRAASGKLRYAELLQAFGGGRP